MLRKTWPREREGGIGHREADHAAARGGRQIIPGRIGGEMLVYIAFPCEHWTRLQSNNMLSRIQKLIRGRARIVGAFPANPACPDVGRGPATSHRGHEVGHATLPDHGPAR
ncbi:transposase [Bremerella sp. JC770]|uniref:transposase n=1 Tax=Bremerella sp. JC770 TaxID=3232137 RepID=UPI0034592BE7